METEIVGPPRDCISKVCFSPCKSNLLLVSSWDGELRVYDTELNALKMKFQIDSALLDCVYDATGEIAYTGGLGKNLVQCDLKTGKNLDVGTHEKAIRCVNYDEARGLVYSGSWDENVIGWDGGKPVQNLKVDGKVFAMDILENTMIVASSKNRVQVFDIRSLGKELVNEESSLKYQTRSVKLFKGGYYIASVEGRVGMEYFEHKKDAFAFKCHRQKMDGQTYVFPVNCIEVHPIYDTFATGGCDGAVHVWDGKKKKRVASLRKYDTSISSMSFSLDGSKLAIAASYTFEGGIKDHPQDAIFVQPMMDKQVRPIGH